MREVTYKQLDVGNVIIIGYMVGTCRAMGRGGAQAIANLAGELAGEELVRFAESRDLPLDTLADVQRFLKNAGLAGYIDYDETDVGISVKIRDCRICPEQVGHYELPGTLCPWGGLLAGLLGQVLDKRFTSTPRFERGETCVISLQEK